MKIYIKNIRRCHLSHDGYDNIDLEIIAKPGMWGYDTGGFWLSDEVCSIEDQ